MINSSDFYFLVLYEAVLEGNETKDHSKFSESEQITFQPLLFSFGCFSALCSRINIMELEKKRMEELRKAVVDLIEMERRYPPFELFYLMIFPLPNMYDMWVRSII